MRPRLLDLFGGAGGSGKGYELAGFDVTVVDIEAHPDCPFPLVEADAMTVLADADYLDAFDVIHAGPPCQGYTTMSNRYPVAQAEHPQMIAPVREALTAWGGTYVIENVCGARKHLRAPILLSGGMFGLRVHRPRLFESNGALIAPPGRPPVDPIGVYGRHHDGRRLWTRNDGTELRCAHTLEEGRAAMGIDWMQWADLTEAIPPAYTEHIGAQLLTHLERAA